MIEAATMIRITNAIATGVLTGWPVVGEPASMLVIVLVTRCIPVTRCTPSWNLHRS